MMSAGMRLLSSLQNLEYPVRIIKPLPLQLCFQLDTDQF